MLGYCKAIKIERLSPEVTASEIKHSSVSAIQPLPYTQSALGCTREAMKILSHDLSQRIPIRILARKCGLNAWSLQHCFKALYGKTIFDFVQDLRMDLAKSLLKTTSLNLQEIAEQCGFKEQSNFSYAFKKMVGLTPGKWREGRD